MSNVIDGFFDDQQYVRDTVAVDASENPDNAARAFQLSQVTGTPPGVINADLEAFERDTKAKMAVDIVNNNPYIAEYVRQNPLGARVSNDDYANLDGITTSMSTLRNNTARPWWQVMAASTARTIREGGSATMRAVGELTGWEHLVDVGKAVEAGTEAAVPISGAERQSFSGAFGGLLGGLTLAGGAGIVGGLPGAAVQMGLLGGQQAGEAAANFGVSPETQADAWTAGFAINAILGIVPFHYLMKPAQVTTPGLTSYVLAKTSQSAQSGAIFGAAGELQKYLNVLATQTIYNPQAPYHFDLNEALANTVMGALLGPMAPVTRTYMGAGRDIPVNLHPEITELYKKQIQGDMEALDAVFKTVRDSTTRERSPEMLARFNRIVDDREISIPFEAINKLYGEKTPNLQDGILGWVPGFTDQLAAGVMSGADIRITLADWLAKVDPKVMSELKDHVRVRRNGLTLEEAKAMEDIDVFHGSPHEFDAFSMERIGTGEGAQSYGHGLYFAENRQVAETYRQQGYRPKSQNESVAMQALQKWGNDRTRAIHELELDSDKFVKGSAQYREHRAAIKMLREGWAIPEVEGNTYRARIRANPEDFLDWDRPLTEQSPRVQEALNRIAQSPEIARRITTQPEFEMLGPKVGRDIYGGIGRGITRGEGIGERADRAASERLRSEGIPGIRYLDQGSRPNMHAVETFTRHVKDAEELVSRGGEDAEIGQRLLATAKENLAKAERELHTYNYVLFDDSLIEILDRNGQAVQAVRKQAGLEPMAEIGSTPAIRERVGETRQYSAETEAFIPDKLTPAENMLWGAFDETLGKYIPGFIETQAATTLKSEGNKVRGVFISYSDRLPIILFALKGRDIIGTARHEAIHALRNLGFFTEAEWATLRRAALEEKWFDKERTGEGSSVLNRYNNLFSVGDTARLKDLDLRRDHGPEYIELKKKQDAALDRFLEEAVADEFKYWNHTAENPTIAHKVFQKLREFLEKLKEVFTDLRTTNPEVAKIFEAIEAGEIGGRKPTGVTEAMTAAEKEKPTTKAKQLELDVTRQEDKSIFEKARLAGLTEADLKHYMNLIAQRNEQDIAVQRERAQVLERRQQTQEWKTESAELQEQIRNELLQRPDVAATNFFRHGELDGEKISPRPKIDEELLTPEQKAALPDYFYGKDGLHPDDAAGLFGFASGVEMLLSVARFEQSRGKVSPAEFLRRIVRDETQKRMVEKYGDLDENILSAAEDHVLGNTQMDLLHEQTVLMAALAKAEFTLTKADLARGVEAVFAGSQASKVSVADYLNLAGRVHRAERTALLKGDYKEAFKQAQNHQWATMLAREAKAWEKDTASFERITERYQRREVKGRAQEFTDFIQKMYNEAGIPSKRSPDEIATAIDRADNTTLDKFVERQVGEGWPLQVPDWILEGQLRQRVANMTVEEARQFRTAVRSMDAAGREAQQVTIDGERRDFEVFKAEIVANIETLPERDPNKPYKILNLVDAQLARMEEIIKDLDLREKAGPLWNAVYRPLMESKHTEYSMTETLVKNLGELRGDLGRKWRKSLQDTIPQDFLYDPGKKVPVLFDLSREHMIGIMFNWGNRSNIDAFTRGYAGKERAKELEGQLRALFDKHATKEDWHFVQSMWNLFKDWQKAGDEMYASLGVPPKWIPPEAVVTPHGTFEGGYFPIIRDRMRDPRLPDDPGMDSKAFFGPTYGKFTPTNSYTVERSGYVGPIKFQNSIQDVMSRMQQEIHDISYRRQLMDARRILRDPSIRQAIRRNYGQEYVDQIDPWLKDIASQFNKDDRADAVITDFIRRMRLNLVSHTLPFNIPLYLTPDMGKLGRTELVRFNADRTANMALVMEKSKELPHTFRNMDRDFREQLERVIGASGFEGARAAAVRMGFRPAVWLSQQFRAATFLAEYKRGLAEGLSDGDASAHADYAVRSTHGSGGIPDLPRIMRGSEYKKPFTVFYGYFSTMVNWSRQIPGNLRRGEYSESLGNLWGSVILGSILGAAFYTQIKEDDSIWKIMAKALTNELSGRVPLLRDIVSYNLEGYPSRTPFASVFTAVSTAAQDVKKTFQDKKTTNVIKHTANAVGLATGLPLGQVGKTTQFLRDVQTRKQNPRNLWEYRRGLIWGESQLKR